MREIAKYCFHNKITGRIESDVYHISERNRPGVSEYVQYYINGQQGISTEWLRLIYESESLDVHHINGDPKDDRLINIRFMTKSEHHKLHRRKQQDFYYQFGLKPRFPAYSLEELARANDKRIVKHFKNTTVRI